MRRIIHKYALTALLQSAVLTVPAQVIHLPDGSRSTHTGSTFAVDEAYAGHYVMSDAVLYPKGGAIVARSPVTNPIDAGNPNWNMMSVSYRDPDGAESQYRVVVRLKRVHVTTGLPSTVATFDSNTTYSPGTGVQERMQAFSEAFDFVTYSYYLEATLSGPSGFLFGQPQPFIYGVMLVEYKSHPL